MSVKRFDMHGSSHISGEYVSYSDCAKLEAENAALKEENERLSDGLSHHMNISQVLADGNANMYEMVMERDAEIELLKARVAELEESIARCRQQASYYIGNEGTLKNQLSKVRDIANEVLISKGVSQ